MNERLQTALGRGQFDLRLFSFFNLPWGLVFLNLSEYKEQKYNHVVFIMHYNPVYMVSTQYLSWGKYCTKTSCPNCIGTSTTIEKNPNTRTGSGFDSLTATLKLFLARTSVWFCIGVYVWFRMEIFYQCTECRKISDVHLCFTIFSLRSQILIHIYY